MNFIKNDIKKIEKCRKQILRNLQMSSILRIRFSKNLSFDKFYNFLKVLFEVIRPGI